MSYEIQILPKATRQLKSLSIKFPALVTNTIARGVLFVPMHWGTLWADNVEANALTHPEADPDSKQPELKACAVPIKLASLVHL